MPTANPLQYILQIPGAMAQDFTNAIDTLPNIGFQTLLSPVGVLFGTTQAWADSMQSIVDAFDAGDTTTALTDLGQHAGNRHRRLAERIPNGRRR